MEIREAVQKDNEQLLALTRDCPMDGVIKLLIDRKPDFFSLLKEKGDYKVFVALSERRIIGSFALVIKTSFINQHPEKIGYLCDLKIHPQFRNSMVAGRLLRTMHSFMQTLDIHFYLCVTARGNENVELLLKGRAGIPSALEVAHFNVYQILPLRKYAGKLHVDEFRNEDRDQSTHLLNSYYREFQFASVHSPLHNIEGEKAWVIRSGGNITGFISVIDMTPYKQNVVTRIPFYISFLLNVSRLFWPIGSLPKAQSPIKMLYIKYLAFNGVDTGTVLALLHKARHYAFTKGYTFLSYGVDERNTLNAIFQKLPRVTFQSTGYLFNFNPAADWSSNRMYHDNFYQV